MQQPTPEFVRRYVLKELINYTAFLKEILRVLKLNNELSADLYKLLVNITFKAKQLRQLLNDSKMIDDPTISCYYKITETYLMAIETKLQVNSYFKPGSISAIDHDDHPKLKDISEDDFCLN